MHIDTINTSKSPRVLLEIYGTFLCISLLFLVCAPFQKQHSGKKQLSFYKACKLLIQDASDFIKALRSTYRLKKFLCTFNQQLALFAIKDIKKKTPFQKLLADENAF